MNQDRRELTENAAANSRHTKVSLTRIACAVGFVLLLALIAIDERLTAMLTQTNLQQFIDDAGLLGPIAIISLMTLAIVMSPLPSAPIALAAGAAYGHTWGTIYVLAGAEIGALIAFGISRALGYHVLERWFGDRLSFGLLGSQNMLTTMVFVTRLIPFISFDIVSYAAGLTRLAWWRFAVATFLGILPASFALAHLGGELKSTDPKRMTIAVIALGAITLIPIAARLILNRRKRNEND